VQANQVLLRTELTGQGDDVVVLVHDMGLNLECWDEVMPAIQPGRRVLRYDMRGFGLSEKFRTPIAVEDHVEDLHALLDALNIKKPVTVVGGSIGGTIALKFAAKYPERVKAVVSLNGLTKLPNPSPPANPNLVGRDTAKIFETEGVRAYLKTDLDWLYPPQLRTPARLAKLMGMEVSQDPTVRAIHMRIRYMGADYESELPKITAPTLLIAGMINSSYTADEWRLVAKRIPHAELVMIQTAHHAAFESPELVAPLLKRFLDAHRDGRGRKG
jgi:3-oxoadipate enol-lactonase